VTFSLIVAGRFSDVIRNLKEVLPGVPALLVDGLYFAIPNFRNFDLKTRVAYGDPVPLPTLGWITGYAAAYILLLLLVGFLSFRRRDLP
jgi:hypothetical protein